MSRRLPPLNALRAFEAAGRHLSFSKAAEELHVTPAAISHHIKGLEEQLGVALFRREPRRLLLTDAGQRALPGLREAFDRMATTLAEIEQSAEGELLTISATPSLASKWLLPRLRHFRRANPELEVRLDASAHLVDFSRETDVDVGIRHGTGDYPGLEVEWLMTTSRTPVCAPTLLDGPNPLRTPQDLRHHTLLHVPWQCCGATDPDWPEWLASAGVTDVDAERGPRFNEYAYAIQAAVEGDGVVLATDVLVADDIAAGRLVKPFGSGLAGETPFGYYLVYPPAKARVKRVKRFREWLLDEVAAHNEAATEDSAMTQGVTAA